MNNQITMIDQTALLNNPFDVDLLKSLEKNSVSRIQIVSFKGNRALKSVQDSERKVRVVIVSLLIKIFSDLTPANRDRLERLKKIIYSSKLQKITDEKGILRENLLKAVAVQFKKMKSRYSVEMDVIKMFNCSPFIDEIILSALRQQNPLLFESDCEVCSWLDRQLSIKILWNQQNIIEQKEQQLCLAGLGQQFHASKDCKCLQCDYKTFQQYLRFSSNEHFSNIQQQINEIYDRNTKSLFNCQLSPEEKNDKKSEAYPTIYYSSIQTMSPSTKKQSVGKKQNKHVSMETPEIKLFDTPIQRPFQEKKNQRQTNRVSNSTKSNENTVKIRRSNQNNEEKTSFWFLCCGNI